MKSAPVSPRKIRAGEKLMADIYNALCGSKQWNKTLFVITYDEHGGGFDHVPPPEATPPDPDKPEGEMGFVFNRMGVRVPAVLDDHLPVGGRLSTVEQRVGEVRRNHAQRFHHFAIGIGPPARAVAGAAVSRIDLPAGRGVRRRDGHNRANHHDREERERAPGVRKFHD